MAASNYVGALSRPMAAPDTGSFKLEMLYEIIPSHQLLGYPEAMVAESEDEVMRLLELKYPAPHPQLTKVLRITHKFVYITPVLFFRQELTKEETAELIKTLYPEINNLWSIYRILPGVNRGQTDQSVLLGNQYYFCHAYDPKAAARQEQESLQAEKRRKQEEAKRTRQWQQRDKTRAVAYYDMGNCIGCIGIYLNQFYNDYCPSLRFTVLGKSTYPGVTGSLVGMLHFLQDFIGRRSIYRAVPQLKTLRKKLYNPGSWERIERQSPRRRDNEPYQVSVTEELYVLLPPPPGLPASRDPLGKRRRKLTQQVLQRRQEVRPKFRRSAAKPLRRRHKKIA